MAKKKELTPKEEYELLSEEEKLRLTIARFSGDFSTMELVYRPPTAGSTSEPNNPEA